MRTPPASCLKGAARSVSNTMRRTGQRPHGPAARSSPPAAFTARRSRSGHLSNAGIYAGALVRTDTRLEEPDLQINMSGWSAIERLRTGIKPHPFSAFTFSPVHLRPDGRGWVRIKSPDPLAPPAIQFNFLASDYDFQALIYGMKLSRKIAAQPAMKPFVAEEVLPGAAVESEA